MPFVTIADLVSGLQIAVPKNVVSYIALWTGQRWILRGDFTATDVLHVADSFVVR